MPVGGAARSEHLLTLMTRIRIFVTDGGEVLPRRAELTYRNHDAVVVPVMAKLSLLGHPEDPSADPLIETKAFRGYTFAHSENVGEVELRAQIVAVIEAAGPHWKKVLGVTG